MTGKPNLSNANKSWIRAKTEHDKITEVIYRRVKTLEEKRNIKERILYSTRPNNKTEKRDKKWHE